MNKWANVKRMCQAMQDARIEDPDSIEGIRFCAGSKDTESQCPYPNCIVFEQPSATSKLGAQRRRKVARGLRSYGVSVEDIALILDKSVHTIRGYIRK